MQRKRRNINFGYFSGSSGKSRLNSSITKLTLHSIPTVGMSKSNKKSLVAGRNPFCGQFPKRFLCLGFATLLIFGLVLKDVNLLGNHAYALEEAEEKEENDNASMSELLDDAASVEEKPESEAASVLTTNNDDDANDTPVTFSTRAATAGLTIDGSTSSSTETVTVAPGSVGYSKEHTIGVNVTDASAYTLKISGNTNLSGPSGATAIGGAGNKQPSAMTDNTWGYGWGSTGTAKESLYYQSLSTDGANLSGDSLSTNGGASFSRKLVFAAKFGANNTNAGTYRGNVTLSLVVTPRAIGEWRMSNATSSGYDSASTIKNSGITTMQQMTSSICNQVSTPAASSTTVPTMRLKDSRDNNEYIIAKFADGRCWMVENLRITGRTIKAAESDFSGSDITLPSSAKSDFTDANKFTYRSGLFSEANSGSTGYYNWYTATAGAGTSSATSGTVNTSICPKSWKLPSGGSSGEYKAFATAESIANSADGSKKIQASPYNFKYTGYVDNGSLSNGTGNGFWWSSTADGATLAYYLLIGSSNVYPGTGNNSRYVGFAVRCIARS